MRENIIGIQVLEAAITVHRGEGLSMEYKTSVSQRRGRNAHSKRRIKKKDQPRVEPVLLLSMSRCSVVIRYHLQRRSRELNLITYLLK